MKKIHAPINEEELTVLKSVLEAEGIRFFVKNEHFSSMYPFLQITSSNEKAFFVSDDDEPRARAVVEDYLKKVGGDSGEDLVSELRGWAKATAFLRALVEALMGHGAGRKRRYRR